MMPDDSHPPQLSRLMACWGTAHLAWGVVVLAALLYAAQHGPLESSPHHQKLSLATFLVGLVSLGLLGWQQIDRGWRLRHPSARPVPLRWLEVVGYVLVVVGCWHALSRGPQSRLLATGLDRLLVAVCLSSGMSLLLWISVKWSAAHRRWSREEPLPDYGLPYWLLGSQVAFVVLLEWLERQPW